MNKSSGSLKGITNSKKNSNTRKNIPNAHTVYEAYRYLGDDSISIDERKKKITPYGDKCTKIC